MTKLVKILEDLPGLTDAERQQLLMSLKALCSFGPSSQVTNEAGQDDHESFALSCIADSLASLGVEFTTAPMLRSSSNAGFRAKVESVMVFVSKVCKTRSAQRALLLLGVELLYSDISRLGLPASARMVMRHFHRIPSVLNRHFPGYAASGLLGFVVDKSGTET